MKVTDEAWAEQVQRGDNAEMREASAYIGITQVLREHDACLCRHCKRILGNVLKAREMHPLWRELSDGIERIKNPTSETQSAHPDVDIRYTKNEEDK